MPNLTDLSYIRQLCQTYGIRPSKRFGQNFLVNPGVCPKLCDVAEITPDTNVLEIGPGIGTLTAELAKRAKKVVAVETDRALLPVLSETLADFQNCKVVEGDILKIDIGALLQQEFEGPVMLCANLPYNITSPILMHLLESRLPFTRLTVMVQKEAAQRITANTGERQAGAISYAVWYYAMPRFCFSVKPGSFYPPPKVTSAVIRLNIREKTLFSPHSPEEKRLFTLVRQGFSQRRKTLLNAAVSTAAEKEQLAAAMNALGLDDRLRPEQLTLEQYAQLARQLGPAAEEPNQ